MDDSAYPASKTIWKEFCRMMRQVEGHCNKKKPSVDRYWVAVDPVKWPVKPVWTLKDEDKWPQGDTLKGARAQKGQAGKPMTVSGLKYSQRGGYHCKITGPSLQPQLAKALVEAANHSLATSTWKSYTSVWRQVGKIAQEIGTHFRLPLTTVMVRGLVGALIKKGRKSGTILSYMASLKKAHEMEGLDSKALDDHLVHAAIKGVKNKETLTPTPRAVMTLEKLARCRIALRKLKIASHRKKAVWACLVFLFMGSLRGSEILATDKTKYDPLKTLLAKDLKMVSVKTGGETVTTLQLTLKAPKTSRSLPVQVVELPEVGGWLCPVQAYKNWQESKKGKQTGDKPVFVWKDSSLITLSEMNTVLSILLEGEDPPVTTRAFRPALPTILARQGASEELLKSLGRWTSRTYLNYVREGRTGDWRGLLQKLRGLKI